MPDIIFLELVAMKNIPLWLKIVGAVLLTAALFGGARILLWLDQMGNFKGGLD